MHRRGWVVMLALAVCGAAMAGVRARVANRLGTRVRVRCDGAPFTPGQLVEVSAPQRGVIARLRVDSLHERGFIGRAEDGAAQLAPGLEVELAPGTEVAEAVPPAPVSPSPRPSASASSGPPASPDPSPSRASATPSSPSPPAPPTPPSTPGGAVTTMSAGALAGASAKAKALEGRVNWLSAARGAAVVHAKPAGESYRAPTMGAPLLLSGGDLDFGWKPRYEWPATVVLKLAGDRPVPITALAFRHYEDARGVVENTQDERNRVQLIHISYGDGAEGPFTDLGSRLLTLAPELQVLELPPVRARFLGP